MSKRIKPPPAKAKVTVNEADMTLAAKIGRAAEEARRKRVGRVDSLAGRKDRPRPPARKGVAKLPNGIPTGRPPGAGNRVSTYIKMAITGAMEDVGEDGKGKGGTRGYMRYLARFEAASFVGLVKRVIPVQVKADLDPGSLLTKLITAAAAQRTVRSNGGGILDAEVRALPPPKRPNGS